MTNDEISDMFRTRVGDSLEVLDAIREALAGQDKEQIIELVNGYIDRAQADLRSLVDCVGPTSVAGMEACIDGFCHIAEARGEHLRCEGKCAYK